MENRIAERMVHVAEAEGKLIPGESTVIEPTLGNTTCYFTTPQPPLNIRRTLPVGIGLAIS